MFFVPSYTYVLCLCWIMDTDEIKRHTYIHLYTTSFIILYINYIKYTVLEQVLRSMFQYVQNLHLSHCANLIQFDHRIQNPRFCPSDGRQSLRDPSAELGPRI